MPDASAARTALIDPIQDGIASGWHVIDAATLVGPVTLEADAVIVGTGASASSVNSWPISRICRGDKPLIALSMLTTVSRIASPRSEGSRGNAPASMTGTTARMIASPSLSSDCKDAFVDPRGQ